MNVVVKVFNVIFIVVFLSLNLKLLCCLISNKPIAFLLKYIASVFLTYFAKMNCSGPAEHELLRLRRSPPRHLEPLQREPLVDIQKTSKEVSASLDTLIARLTPVDVATLPEPEPDPENRTSSEIEVAVKQIEELLEKNKIPHHRFGKDDLKVLHFLGISGCFVV